MRARIRVERPGDHMSAGIRHFIHGVGGGVSGVFTSSVRGASEDGVRGFVRGFSWGAIGLIRKPVAGVLDLAAGAASAVRDTSALTPVAADEDAADASNGASHDVRSSTLPAHTYVAHKHTVIMQITTLTVLPTRSAAARAALLALRGALRAAAARLLASALARTESARATRARDAH